MQQPSFEPETFWHTPVDDLLKKLGANPEEGLSESIAEDRLKTYGHNVLKEQKKRTSLKLFFSQLNNPLIYMLLFAATLSLILYDKTDAIIIFIILFASALLGFIQEKNATQAMEKLLSLVQIKVRVLRDRTIQEIPIEKVVPGDIIALRAGDVIPGDSCLLEANDLYVDEAALTGETFYAEKHPGTIENSEVLSKRMNALFMGTHVVSGTAKALVVQTGTDTQFGNIASRLSTTPPETAFEHGVHKFGYFLMEVTFVLLFIIFACNMYLHRPVVESLLFALSLSVGLTPQLLPAIITINLAKGAQMMAKNHVIVKKLTSLENFGSMDVLCSDKTGTLTSGTMSLYTACDVLGKENPQVLLYASLNALFQSGYTNPIDTLLTTLAPEETAHWKKLDEVPYDFTRKRVSILAQNESSSFVITKGAFDQVLSICTHAVEGSGSIVSIDTMQEAIKERFIAFSTDGYRVLGLCYKEDPSITTLSHTSEEKMTFLGFLVFQDPMKEDIIQTIDGLEHLGIHLKIITGDNKFAATHVAKILKIPEDRVITGPEVHAMDDRALEHQVNCKSIFAEIEPNQKERIILALRKRGHVVGFIGDGINDVTALHTADVSISVNNAVDAAKEVSHMILTEKNLSVLKEGVLAGRKTFANTLKYIFMASSANFGNMFSMAGASLFLSFLPLLPKQVLLTNLMTDFPEMTIATDDVDEEVLQKPLRWDLTFIRNFMVVFGLISSFFDYATFGVLLWLQATIDEFRTGWFVESVVSATLIVLVVRTFKPFFKSRPSKYLLYTVIGVVIVALLLPVSPFVQYLGLTPISSTIYLAIGTIVVLYMFSVEYAKRKLLKNGWKQRKM